MPLLGNPLATAFSAINKQTITGDGTVGPYTLDYPAGSDQDVEVFVNNVRQEPGVAYTVAGTAMTMTGVVQSSDDFYVVFQGKAQQTVSHPAGSPLQATSGTFSGDLTVDTNTLYVDSTNNRVGIANASPSVELDVTGAAKVSGDLTVDSSTLYVDSTNNRVGIGDTLPSAKLDVYSTSGSTTDIGRFEAAVGGYTGTSLIAGNTLGYDGSYSLFKCIVDSDGDGGGPFTVFVVKGDGRVHVNQTSDWANSMLSAYATSAPAISARTNQTNGTCLITRHDGGGTAYNVQFYNSTNFVGSIQTTASATSYVTSSDYRLKTAVNYEWDATTRLKQLRPARFEWIADGDDAVPVDGFLAHEVQSVVPEAITGTHDEVDDDGNPVYQGIDQSKLVPLLVKTIQELEARVAALENA